MRSWVVLCGFAFVAGCGPSESPLVLATTTSVVNSGLLQRVLPEFPDTVRVLQVGSGRALAMLESGQADAAISHAPRRESELLDRHASWVYRKFLYNDFLIVGPAGDPAGIAGMADAATAMKRIADSGQRFLSRGDGSGTHEREQQLWMAAGVVPSTKQVVVAGAGMGQTLRIASETRTYTLADRGTFEALKDRLQLRVLVEGDPRLVNTYAVTADSANRRGVTFARWLAEGRGRDHLSETITKSGLRGFAVWPANRDGSRPDARPF